MSAYYYVSASLPMLKGPDDSPVINSAVMLDTCRRFMKKNDYDDIASVSLNPAASGSGGLTSRYHDWENNLRNDLARMRAIEQGVEPEHYQRDYSPVIGTQTVASAAMDYTSPLEAELYLDSSRWEKIEELSAGHFFDMDFLRAYRLKLLIQERHSLFDQEKGFSMYRRIHQNVLESFGRSN